jgi:membrane protein implicated in regulation of membrane protease activity
MWDAYFLLWCSIHPKCLTGFLIALLKEWYVAVIIVVWIALLTYGLYKARQQRRKAERENVAK